VPDPLPVLALRAAAESDDPIISPGAAMSIDGRPSYVGPIALKLDTCPTVAPGTPSVQVAAGQAGLLALVGHVVRVT
jgi:hypothetical protein